MPDFVIHPHDALSRKAVARPVDADMLRAGEALRSAAQEVSAYGLAAAHLGLVEPLVVMSVAEDRTLRDYRILYNPEVVLLSPETATDAEGSVSLPGIEVPVERSIWAEVAYDDADGIRQTARFEGFVARVAQHEIDQVNGIFFLSRISRLKRDTALRKFDKSRR